MLTITQPDTLVEHEIAAEVETLGDAAILGAARDHKQATVPGSTSTNAVRAWSCGPAGATTVTVTFESPRQEHNLRAALVTAVELGEFTVSA